MSDNTNPQPEPEVLEWAEEIPAIIRWSSGNPMVAADERQVRVLLAELLDLPGSYDQPLRHIGGSRWATSVPADAYSGWARNSDLWSVYRATPAASVEWLI